MCDYINMEHTGKTCKKCNVYKIKERDFTRSKIKGKWQYGHCKKCHQAYTRAWRYGIEVEDMNTLLKNSTNCGVCEREFTTNRKVIDHCHKHGHIRGILCDPCNTTLGHLEKDEHMLGNFIAYLLENNKLN